LHLLAQGIGYHRGNVILSLKRFASINAWSNASSYSHVAEMGQGLPA
jgi:hypothetical protein